MRIEKAVLTLCAVFFVCGALWSEVLEVKPGRNAMVKVAPTGTAAQFPDRLPAGSQHPEPAGTSRHPLR